MDYNPKLDNLYEFMSWTSNELGIVALTETSEKEDIGFIGNVDIDGYQKFNTASKSSKGGTAIYVNKDFDSFQRIDFNINSLEYESTWIEIKNERSKNIVIASIYRHLHSNFNNFFQYLENCLNQVCDVTKGGHLWKFFKNFNNHLTSYPTNNLTAKFSTFNADYFASYQL